MDSEDKQRFFNYCRIQQLLIHGTKYLHLIFKQRWEIYYNLNSRNINPWNNAEESGKQLIQLCLSPSYRSRKQNLCSEMKDSLQGGNVDSWDITSSNFAIKAVSNEILYYGGMTDNNEDQVITDLRKVRNEIVHRKLELSDDEFVQFWNRLEEILIKFGEDVTEINKIKESLNEFGQAKIASEPESVFFKMKEKANKLFKVKNYVEALQAYNQILQLPNTLPENQAIIFSNRCAAYLMFNDTESLKMAKRDAKWAIKLWPCWWRGYYRLGCVQIKNRDLSDAEINLQKALALNPESKEVMDEISAVRQECGIISRQEHLRPAHQPISYSSVMEEVCARTGQSKKEYERNLKILKDTPFFGDVVKGHYFRDGEGVPRDYYKAAAHYAKAANAGNHEGMFNLALLYKNGQGVARDFNESLRWLLKAAEGKAPIMIGSGVPEAQHSLGIKFEEGIGVKRNYKTAVEWYKKAVQNEFPPSANNLGLLYKNGFGVERCLKKAFQYFKFAANGGDTPSMNNLAQCYFAAEGTGSIVPTDEDIAEGMKWLKIAAENGDMVSAKEFERRQNLTPTEAKVESMKDFFISTSGLGPKVNHLDEKQFRKEVEKAAKNGSIIAQRQLDIWVNLNIAMESFRNNDSARLFAALSKAIRLHHQLVEVPEIFKPIILRGMKDNPYELDIITCYIQMNSKNPLLVEFIYTLMDHYIDFFDGYLISMAISRLIVDEDFDKAISTADTVLEVLPQSTQFLYLRAIALCMKPSPECIKALDEFLAVAPKDHDKFPACHYRKASYYICVEQKLKFADSFKAGLESEKNQLPCFLPYQFPMKDLLMKFYAFGDIPVNIVENQSASNITSTPFSSSLENLMSNPQRKIMLLKNRELFLQLAARPNDKYNTVPKPANFPKPPRLASLKAITLKDINPTIDKMYDGYVLEVKIIDFSYLMVAINTVIEDENGDIQRLAVYNWPLKGDRKAEIAEAIKTFRPNVMVSIINPYMRLSSDMKNIIRVENPVYIRLDNTSADQKCTFCGKEAKVLPCSKCMMVRYCSKECQRIDWIEFKHKEMCEHLKNYLS